MAIGAGVAYSAPMDRTRLGARWKAGFLGALFALSSLISFSPRASAEARTATTTVGITVERHAAILLPADEAGIARASRAAGNDRPSVSAAGNGTPAVFVKPDSRPMAPVSAARERVAVTVFEP